MSSLTLHARLGNNSHLPNAKADMVASWLCILCVLFYTAARLNSLRVRRGFGLVDITWFFVVVVVVAVGITSAEVSSEFGAKRWCENTVDMRSRNYSDLII